MLICFAPHVIKILFFFLFRRKPKKSEERILSVGILELVDTARKSVIPLPTILAWRAIHKKLTLLIPCVCRLNFHCIIKFLIPRSIARI